MMVKILWAVLWVPILHSFKSEGWPYQSSFTFQVTEHQHWQPAPVSQGDHNQSQCQGDLVPWWPGRTQCQGRKLFRCQLL